MPGRAATRPSMPRRRRPPRSRATGRARAARHRCSTQQTPRTRWRQTPTLRPRPTARPHTAPQLHTTRQARQCHTIRPHKAVAHTHARRLSPPSPSPSTRRLPLLAHTPSAPHRPQGRHPYSAATPRHRPPHGHARRALRLTSCTAWTHPHASVSFIWGTARRAMRLHRRCLRKIRSVGTLWCFTTCKTSIACICLFVMTAASVTTSSNATQWFVSYYPFVFSSFLPSLLLSLRHILTCD